jgi:AcrR family transcriptional regulator
MPRPRKTEEEIQAMREQILDAAFALLQQEGIEGVSIRKIADRIGVSHMSLYHYFENRAAIVKSLRERAYARMEAFCAASLRRAETGDVLAQIRASLERFVRLARDYPKLYQLAWRRSPDSTAWRVDSENLTRILDHHARLIERCIERGQCAARDPDLAAVMAFSIVNGTLVLVHNLAPVDRAPRTELEAEMIEAAITYLTRPENPERDDRGEGKV